MSITLPEGYEPPAEALEAIKQLEEGYPVVYLAGKAGCGKSTFLEYLKTLKEAGDPLMKGMVILAPTGIAAINVGAQTIHSFLKIAPHERPGGRWSQGNPNPALKRLTLLVIDEISMVRADLLDLMDEKLRYYLGEPDLPFGGVPVLCVGDIFQLAPVLTQEDSAMFFSSGYPSPWFFYAKIFNSVALVCQELTKVYRQKDPHFLEILNNIRLSKNLRESLAALNAATQKIPKNYPMSLTSTNWSADEVNQHNLRMLTSPSITYKAQVGDGVTPSDMKNFQSPPELILREGARVMATANLADLGIVNGHLGWVEEVKKGSVRVAFDHGSIVVLTPFTWKKVVWGWDSKKNSFESSEKGKYSQIPLRLGYAVSIHKAQGLTLDSVSIDLGNGAFASGQTYVALSRCTTLEGIHLTRHVTVRDLILDEAVTKFYDHYFAPNPSRFIPPPPTKRKPRLVQFQGSLNLAPPAQMPPLPKVSGELEVEWDIPVKKLVTEATPTLATEYEEFFKQNPEARELFRKFKDQKIVSKKKPKLKWNL